MQSSDTIRLSPQAVGILRSDRPSQVRGGADALSSLRNEATHFIQDAVLKEDTSQASEYMTLHKRNKRTGRIGEVLHETGTGLENARNISANVEALAWNWYRSFLGADGQLTPGGGAALAGELGRFMNYERLYEAGDGEGGLTSSARTYGGVKTRGALGMGEKTDSYIDDLFHEIAAAHGHKLGREAVTPLSQKERVAAGNLNYSKWANQNISAKEGFSRYYKAKANSLRTPNIRDVAPSYLAILDEGKFQTPSFGYDRDVSVSPTDIENRIRSMVSLLDTDGDGAVSDLEKSKGKAFQVRALENLTAARSAGLGPNEEYIQRHHRVARETQSTLVPMLLERTKMESPIARRRRKKEQDRQDQLLNTYVSEGRPTDKTYKGLYSGRKGKTYTGMQAFRAQLADDQYVKVQLPLDRQKEIQESLAKEEAIVSANKILQEAGLDALNMEGIGDSPEYDSQIAKLKKRQQYYTDLSTGADKLSLNEIEEAFLNDLEWGRRTSTQSMGPEGEHVSPLDIIDGPSKPQGSSPNLCP